MNIIEILKKVPLGTKLYSPICGECELRNVLDNTFSVTSGKMAFVFSQDGRYTHNGEICIFPSKENKDWNNFQILNSYNNGDIIYTINKNNHEYITIFKCIEDDSLYSCVDLLIKTRTWFVNTCFSIYNIKEHRLATKEEKEILFEQLKHDGYEWDEQTKTLNSLIKDKFDISTLKPFDQVLVRDSNTDVWEIDFFNSNRDKYFKTMTGGYEQCIPYEPNKHLVDTDEKCDNYYINW